MRNDGRGAGGSLRARPMAGRGNPVPSLRAGLGPAPTRDGYDLEGLAGRRRPALLERNHLSSCVDRGGSISAASLLCSTDGRTGATQKGPGHVKTL